MSYRILVVDDEPAVRRVVGRMLQSEEKQVFYAASGSEALTEASTLMPDLILLDVNLPDVKGPNICWMLKHDPRTAQIPVLFMSGEGRIGAVEDALEQGGAGYLCKPFDPERLAMKVGALLRR